MPVRYFLDTNIVVYSFDSTAPRKQTTAKKLIKNAIGLKIGIISYQVIQEFINVATHKFREPLKAKDCKEYVERFLAPICEVSPSIDLFEDAIDIKSETGYGYYDSLIVASAVKGNATILYTEDLHHGRKIRGLKIINPFRGIGDR
jgi:predicted nucleic acid-binding protein